MSPLLDIVFSEWGTSVLKFTPGFVAAGSFFSFAPLFGSGVTADSGKKFGLSVIVALYIGEIHLPNVSYSYLVPALVLALISGLIVSLPLILLSSGAELLGEVTDVARGQSTSGFIDPQLQIETSVLGAGLKQMTLAWALSFFALPTAMVALKELCLELGSTTSLFQLGSGLGLQIVSITCRYLSGVMLIFFPLIAVWIVVGFFLLFLARIVPGVSGSTEALFLKTICSFAILCALVSFGETDAKIIAVVSPQTIVELIK